MVHDGCAVCIVITLMRYKASLLVAIVGDLTGGRAILMWVQVRHKLGMDVNTNTNDKKWLELLWMGATV